MNSPRYSSIAFDRLPRFPAVVSRVLRHVKDPEISPDNLKNLLAPEIDLCDGLVRLANHPLFVQRIQVQSLNQAIVCLGREEFSNLLFTQAAFSLFREDLTVFEATQFRMHALSCGVLARELARRFRIVDPGTAFRAGLVHDIGIIAVSKGPKEAFLQANLRARERRLSPIDMEVAAMGFHHGHFGLWYGEMLGLDRSVLQAIRFHHDPESAPAPRALAAVVSLGDLLSISAGFGYEDDDPLESRTMLDRHPAWEILCGEQPELRGLKLWEVTEKILNGLEQIRDTLEELCEEQVPA